MNLKEVEYMNEIHKEVMCKKEIIKVTLNQLMELASDPFPDDLLLSEIRMVTRQLISLMRDIDGY